MLHKKRIAVSSHDAQKTHLLQWLKRHEARLKNQHELIATSTTAHLIAHHLGWRVKRVEAGSLGGDYQLAAKIVSGRIDILVFFWEPINLLPHDSDMHVLLRAANLWNIPVITNSATGDYLVNSIYFDKPYQAQKPDYSQYFPQQNAKKQEE